MPRNSVSQPRKVEYGDSVSSSSAEALTSPSLVYSRQACNTNIVQLGKPVIDDVLEFLHSLFQE
jgi:hypothetical protein